MVDLVSMNLLIWEPGVTEDGSDYQTHPLVCSQEGSGQSLKTAFIEDNLKTKLSSEYLNQVLDHRSHLIDQVSYDHNYFCLLKVLVILFFSFVCSLPRQTMHCVNLF